MLKRRRLQNGKEELTLSQNSCTFTAQSSSKTISMYINGEPIPNSRASEITCLKTSGSSYISARIDSSSNLVFIISVSSNSSKTTSRYATYEIRFGSQIITFNITQYYDYAYSSTESYIGFNFTPSESLLSGLAFTTNSYQLILSKTATWNISGNIGYYNYYYVNSGEYRESKAFSGSVTYECRFVASIYNGNPYYFSGILISGGGYDWNINGVQLTFYGYYTNSLRFQDQGNGIWKASGTITTYVSHRSQGSSTQTSKSLSSSPQANPTTIANVGRVTISAEVNYSDPSNPTFTVTSFKFGS